MMFDLEGRRQQEFYQCLCRTHSLALRFSGYSIPARFRYSPRTQRKRAPFWRFIFSEVCVGKYA